MTSSTTCIVEHDGQDINASDLVGRFANTLLRTKRANGTWVASSSPLSMAITQQIIIPRVPLRRLHPAHMALKGTAQRYEAKLLEIFRELADIEPSEIEKTLRRMRGRQDIEP